MVIIKTKRLILRDLERNDRRDLAEQANNLNVSRYLETVPYPYSIKDAESFIKHCKKEARKKPREKYELGIELKQEKKLIGIISLTKVDRFNKTGGFGYWLGEKYWKQGIMTEAFEKLIAYAFTKLRLQRLNVEAFVENEASNALIRKMGFRYEGTRLKFMRSKSTGKIHDIHIYGLLKEEWRK